MKKSVLLGKLFVSTFLLSAFTFGGGYVIISLMKKKFVDELHWLDEEEMLDFTAIAQSCPGAVAVNASILVGSRVAGVAGMLVALVGTVLPPLLIIGVLSFFYTAFRDNFAVRAVLKGMQAGVVAVILDVVIQLGGRVIRQKNAVSIAVMVLAFVVTFVFQVNVVLILLACAAVGVVQALVRSRRQRRDG